MKFVEIYCSEMDIHVVETSGCEITFQNHSAIVLEFQDEPKLLVSNVI